MQPEDRPYKGRRRATLLSTLAAPRPGPRPLWPGAGPFPPARPHPAGKQGPGQDVRSPQPVGTPPQALRAAGSPSAELPQWGQPESRAASLKRLGLSSGACSRLQRPRCWSPVSSVPGVRQGLSPHSAVTPVPVSLQFPGPKSQWPSFSLRRAAASPSHPDPVQTQWLCQPPAPSSRSPNSTPAQLPLHPEQDVHSGSWPCSPHPHWFSCARDWCPPSRLRLLLIAARPRPLHSLAEGAGKPRCLFKVAPCAARPSNTMKHMHNYT